MAENGNAAALRAACKVVVSSIIEQTADADEVTFSGPAIADAIMKARAALAAPARNCDVGTEEEQQERFREFCRIHDDAGECGIGRTRAKCPCWRGPENPDCALSWAQMPYEAEGGAE